jgi:hypothetical protein
LLSRNFAVPSSAHDTAAFVFVNARNGLADASITGLRWSGRTVAGALRWADRQLADAGV